ncbi:MAG: hypothetical protein KDN18_00235 [Verrucomicrobiae bacterium]|nr:hypothetical protein [Verrucomicrobiae bacterium]
MKTQSLSGRLFETPSTTKATRGRGLCPGSPRRFTPLAKLAAALRDYPFGCEITARWILREGRSGDRA